MSFSPRPDESMNPGFYDQAPGKFPSGNVWSYRSNLSAVYGPVNPYSQ